MKSSQRTFRNPFRPGAGHMPPFLAGRDGEIQEFRRLLSQETVLENMVLTGLRGVGKTVLLETLKPIALDSGWLWVGTDLSEATSISESNLATRLLTDLSVVTSSFVVSRTDRRAIGFRGESTEIPQTLNYQTLTHLYNQTPGLAVDKLKRVLELVWHCLSEADRPGLVFAYDEAQNLSDHSPKDQYPLSLLLDVFQSIQRRDVKFLLILTGLPTLFPKLVDARTFSERMFRVVFLDRLDSASSREAILRPMESSGPKEFFSKDSVDTLVRVSGGYPYFIQFMSREAYDALIQKLDAGEHVSIPVSEIVRKLDTDFFAGRWARATDRQRELLSVVARLDNSDAEFTVQEVVEKSKEILDKPFSSSHVNQMFVTLGEAGLIYKNRRGKYAFAVPLLNEFILRQLEQSE